MSDFKEEAIIANMMVRITTLENFLISKGLVTRDELDSMNFNSTIAIAKSIFDKSGVSLSDEDINSIIKNTKKD